MSSLSALVSVAASRSGGVGGGGVGGGCVGGRGVVLMLVAMVIATVLDVNEGSFTEAILLAEVVILLAEVAILLAEVVILSGDDYPEESEVIDYGYKPDNFWICCINYTECRNTTLWKFYRRGRNPPFVKDLRHFERLKIERKQEIAREVTRAKKGEHLIHRYARAYKFGVDVFRAIYDPKSATAAETKFAALKALENHIDARFDARFSDAESRAKIASSDQVLSVTFFKGKIMTFISECERCGYRAEARKARDFVKGRIEKIGNLYQKTDVAATKAAQSAIVKEVDAFVKFNRLSCGSRAVNQSIREATLKGESNAECLAFPEYAAALRDWCQAKRDTRDACAYRDSFVAAECRSVIAAVEELRSFLDWSDEAM